VICLRKARGRPAADRFALASAGCASVKRWFLDGKLATQQGFITIQRRKQTTPRDPLTVLSGL
jgi:hypothetical protein